jgi:hypothetical protein
MAGFLKDLQRGWAPLEAYYTLQPHHKRSVESIRYKS